MICPIFRGQQHSANGLVAEENYPKGCWSRQSFDGRTVSGLGLCFHENGDLHGVDIHRGHGADFGGRWELVGMSKLRLTFAEASETCSVHWSMAQATLNLEACTEPSLNGVFAKAPE
jgi:hypothetical protein